MKGKTPCPICGCKEFIVIIKDEKYRCVYCGELIVIEKNKGIIK